MPVERQFHDPIMRQIQRAPVCGIKIWLHEGNIFSEIYRRLVHAQRSVLRFLRIIVGTVFVEARKFGIIELCACIRRVAQMKLPAEIHEQPFARRTFSGEKGSGRKK
jgi:hypothetical protein